MRETCLCGLTYGQFRTGHTFSSVRAEMWVSSGDSTLWRHKTRNMVLGYWRQIKIGMWESHCVECEHYEKLDPEGFAEWTKTIE